LVATLSAGLLLAGCDSATLAQHEQAGRHAAEAWLEQLDSGHYGEAWEMADPLFRAVVTKETWEAQHANLQAQLGTTANRELIVAKYTSSLPGVPAGEYVIVQFRFGLPRGGGFETLAMRRDGDQWRVHRYHIGGLFDR
jgi:hypothetical protein